MNAKQAYNKILSILADGTMCALVSLWFDGDSTNGYNVPSAKGEIMFRALVGVDDESARAALSCIERDACGLTDDFVGWADVLVIFDGPADADTDTGVYVDATRLVGVAPVHAVPDATPIVDEPIPF